MAGNSVRLTMAQALVRYLCNQHTIIDGERVPLFPGVFAIFGHGNVTCPLRSAGNPFRTACRPGAARTSNPWRWPPSATPRPSAARQIMVATSSIGPGALNMVTAAGNGPFQPPADPDPCGATLLRTACPTRCFSRWSISATRPSP